MEILGLLKPDGALRRAAGAHMLQELVSARDEQGQPLCQFLCFREVRLPVSLLERHYQHVQGRDFYPWMIGLLSGSPAWALLVEGQAEGLEKLRRLLGYTRSHQAHPRSLRYQFCPYGGMNGFHLSENEQAARAETALWKQALDLRPGQFTMPVEAYIGRYQGGPDHTTELRQVCFEIKAQGSPATPELIERLRELMAAECVDATSEQVIWLAQALAQGCFLGEVASPPPQIF